MTEPKRLALRGEFTLNDLLLHTGISVYLTEDDMRCEDNFRSAALSQIVVELERYALSEMWIGTKDRL